MYVTLLIIRGLPGSGKKEFARLLTPHVYSPDDYLTMIGEPQGGSIFVQEAYDWCYQLTADRLSDVIKQHHEHRSSIVAVTGVFTEKRYFQRYLDLVKDWQQRLGTSWPQLRIHVIDMFDAGLSDEELAQRSRTPIPVEAIAEKRQRWEH